MNLQESKNSKIVSINMVLIIIVIILMLVLIFVSILNTGKKQPVKDNTIVNNKVENEIANEVEETNNTTVDDNSITNEVIDPNASNPEVAKIGEKTYTSLQEAINDVQVIEPDGSATTGTPSTNIEPTKITLLKNIAGTFIIGANKNIILDMGNFSITSAGDKEVFAVNGNITLQNGKIIGKYNKQQLSAVKVSKSGVLTCVGMGFDLNLSELGWAIVNDGILSLKSTKINYPKGTTISNSGLINEISGDSYISSNDNYIALYNLGTINQLVDGEIVSNSYAIFNSGTIRQMSGNLKITSQLSYGIYNSGNIEVITGDVKISNSAVDSATIYNNGGRIEKINGNVSINAEHSRAIYNMGIITEISGNVNINTNGEYAVSTIYNSNPGELTIMGGTVSHKNGGISVFKEGGTVTIAGGNIPSKYNC